jgi:hypothetical protein
MTQKGPKYPDCLSASPVGAGCNNLQGWPDETAHEAMTTTDPSGKYGFGGTIRAINGALECLSGQGQQQRRIDNYNYNKGILGTTATFGRDTCF